MNTTYQGMHWFKCDLQMQTPADRPHWLGEPLEADESNLTQLAEDYARACYDADLDVIGITDHNFQSKDFIPQLRFALDRLESEYGRHITLFPGFEFEADVGKGMHVICLFEPDSDVTKLNDIDHILTECGVHGKRIKDGVLRKSTERLPEILNAVQCAGDDGKWRGIVIVPHVFEASLFDNDRISEWLQQEEYLNPDLLAVEVPKPVSRMSIGFQQLFRAGDDCQPGWRRDRPIATIMSSDNKMLQSVDDSGRPRPNSIGYRYTWIKMSEPSIESLRQAFLDHDSRIVLPDDVVGDISPAEREKHARILSVSISNAAFLQDQTVAFSPNLNCIIGGRGTGKSTILEGMRIAIGKDQHHQIDALTREKINRIQELLKRNAGTEVRVHWKSAAGVEDKIVYSVGNEKGQRYVEGQDMADLDSYLENLPVQFFSQQQLNQITSRTGNMLLSLLDDFIRDELARLAQQEENTRNEIRRLFSVVRQLEQIEREIRRVRQDIQDHDRQLQARIELLEEFEKYQKLLAIRAYIDEIRESIATDGEQLTDRVNELVNAHESVNAVENEWPEGEWLDEKNRQILDAKIALRDQIVDAVQRYRQLVTNQVFEDDKWPGINQLIERAGTDFEEACRVKGISPDDIDQVQEIGELLREKRADLEQKEAERDRLSDDISKLSNLFMQLHNTWHHTFLARKKIALEIEGLAENVIDLQIAYSNDTDNFLSAWNKNAADGRTRIGRHWEDIGKQILNVFSGPQSTNEDPEEAEMGNAIYLSPWQLIENWLNGESIPSTFQEYLDSLGITFDEIQNHLRQDARDTWETTRTARIADTVDLVLYRADGTGIAGRISDGSLSDGQRNTAALAMILAKGETPLVFDQPEDELDSNFIFRELVPMLRRMKTKRQIILVTHNANLPVNADAELVYALETRDGSGIPLAEGGLDQSGVTQAILEIMEGSEIAFKRRREKYHF